MVMRIPVLETERLNIREFEMGDLEAYNRIANEGFGENTAENSSLESRRSWLDWIIRNYRELDQLDQPPYGDRAVVLKSDGRLIGSVGLVPCMGPFGTLPYFMARSGREDRRNTPEFGLYWVVDTAYQRQGYAAEAAQALIDHVFTHLNLSRIVAMTRYENEPSMGVMRKLGMTLQKNPYPDPFWFQVVGILEHP